METRARAPARLLMRACLVGVKSQGKHICDDPSGDRDCDSPLGLFHLSPCANVGLPIDFQRRTPKPVCSNIRRFSRTLVHGKMRVAARRIRTIIQFARITHHGQTETCAMPPT
jgi:hypothetical protein